jgi:hypothetical protein
LKKSSSGRPRFPERLRRLAAHSVVRDGFCWKAKERRESGEDKREIADQFKRD